VSDSARARCAQTVIEAARRPERTHAPSSSPLPSTLARRRTGGPSDGAAQHRKIESPAGDEGYDDQLKGDRYAVRGFNRAGRSSTGRRALTPLPEPTRPTGRRRQQGRSSPWTGPPASRRTTVETRRRVLSGGPYVSWPATRSPLSVNPPPSAGSGGRPLLSCGSNFRGNDRYRRRARPGEASVAVRDLRPLLHRGGVAHYLVGGVHPHLARRNTIARSNHSFIFGKVFYT